MPVEAPNLSGVAEKPAATGTEQDQDQVDRLQGQRVRRVVGDQLVEDVRRDRDRQRRRRRHRGRPELVRSDLPVGEEVRADLRGRGDGERLPGLERPHVAAAGVRVDGRVRHLARVRGRVPFMSARLDVEMHSRDADRPDVGVPRLEVDRLDAHGAGQRRRQRRAADERAAVHLPPPPGTRSCRRRSRSTAAPRR